MFVMLISCFCEDSVSSELILVSRVVGSEANLRMIDVVRLDGRARTITILLTLTVDIWRALDRATIYKAREANRRPADIGNLNCRS